MSFKIVPAVKYEELQKEYELKINELKEHLKKYTAPSRNKKYYENHRDEIIQKSKEYKEKIGNKNVVSPLSPLSPFIP